MLRTIIGAYHLSSKGDKNIPYKATKKPVNWYVVPVVDRMPLAWGMPQTKAIHLFVTIWGSLQMRCPI